MATTKITTRQIKGEPNALQPRKTNAVSETLDIQEGTYGIGKRFAGVTAISHPDWAGTGEFFVYLNRFDQLVLNDLGGFPDLSTRIARVIIVGGIITAVLDERGHVNGVIDGYQVTYIDGASAFVKGDDVQEALDSIDAYFGTIFTPTPAILVRQDGEDAYNYPNNTIYELDGYEYEVGESRLLVTINGIIQHPPVDYIERDTTSIEFCSPIDHEDVVDILILPGSLGGSNNTTTLQQAYDNSTFGDKSINVGAGGPVGVFATGKALDITGTGSDPTVSISNNSNNTALDVTGDGYFHSPVTVADKLSVTNGGDAPLNLPILTSDPPSPESGDTWISNVAGQVKIKTRVGGTTYSVLLSVD